MSFVHRLRSGGFFLASSCALLGFAPFGADRAHAQLFDNLEAFGARLDVGDPGVVSDWRGSEGPKGLASGDLDSNGSPDLAASNLDGTVTVYLNLGDGKFSEAVHLQTGAKTLRGIIISDLTGDERPDIAVAALLDEAVILFEGRGGGAFGDPVRIPAWVNVRSLAAGDFDGDGALELAAAGSGLGLRQYRRNPGGAFVPAGDLADLDAHGASKPVYSLKAVRQVGASRDELLATHAWSDRVWILGAGPGGLLEQKADVIGVSGVYSLDAAPITSPASTGRPDLVTAHRDMGVIEVRPAIDGPARFGAAVRQQIAIPGAPRAVRIVDLDQDGWNDVVVVLRYLNTVLTYRNEQGTLVPATEMPVGLSPRDLAVADFNLDGQPDLAVANRVSSDLSLLYGHPGQAGFGVLDQFYLVDGEVAALALADLDSDGRDDVIQLHRASGDFSVRLSGPDGILKRPDFYAMGPIPNSMRVKDVNRDGKPDVMTANLGRDSIEEGTLSVRLGDGAGGFGPAMQAVLPPEMNGRLFAVEVADFDGDGLSDAAAGFFDCRLAFFKGRGDGTLTFTQAHFFTYESRVLASGDFDGDGDVDLAGAGYAGDVVVVENQGDLLTTTQLARQDFPPPTEGKFGTRAMEANDLNGDGDLDIVVGSGGGTMVYLGAAGMGFVLHSASLPATDFPNSGIGIADLDGDGDKDIVVACQVLSCIVILTRGADGNYAAALSVDVPSARMVAVGDPDGDGHADLVGTGDVLWTALSSRRAQRSGPPALEAERPVPSGPVLNELLAINNQWPLEVDGNRTVDWLEIYSGAVAEKSLAGWKLRLADADAQPGEPEREYAFPADAKIPGGGLLLLIFSSNVRSPYHTGFKMPGGGGTFTLVDATGGVADRLVYPAQRENLSYSRYRDGVPSFAFNNFPSPGRSNPDNGAIPPILSLEVARAAPAAEGEPLRAPAPGQPIRFEAEGSDDVGIVSASVLYQRMDVPGVELRRAVLYDDGMHGDGAMQDGAFAGLLEPGLPAGAEIRFQVEVEDLSDNITVLPDGGDASDEGDGEGGAFYTLAVGSSFPRVELSEVVAHNVTGLRDEGGGFPDWVEVRNCSEEPAPLDGVLLCERFPATENLFAFPQGSVLAPGEHIVVFCDGSPAQGPLHAPFNLEAGGGRLFLLATAPHGALQAIDAFDFGPQEADRAIARQGCGGRWVPAAPTPGAENVPGGIHTGDVDASGVLNITDPIVLLNYLFLAGPMACPGAADSNGDTAIDLSDAVHVLLYLFSGGPAPVEKATGCVRR